MSKEFWEKIGKQIKQARNRRGMSQSDLGAKVDARKSYISDLERGETTCSFTKLTEIAQALDCTVDVRLNRK